jgi:hypothetical protein
VGAGGEARPATRFGAVNIALDSPATFGNPTEDFVLLAGVAHQLGRVGCGLSLISLNEPQRASVCDLVHHRQVVDLVDGAIDNLTFCSFGCVLSD